MDWLDLLAVQGTLKRLLQHHSSKALSFLSGNFWGRITRSKYRFALQIGTWDFSWGSLPLGLALGSPIFPSGCEGKLGVALESGQLSVLEGLGSVPTGWLAFTIALPLAL